MTELSGDQGHLSRYGELWRPTRRDLIRGLGATLAVAGFTAGIPLGPDTADAALIRQPAGQADWRFCIKCNGLFFFGSDGNYFRENQRCPAGGLHNPAGYNFVLPHDVPETPTDQRDWRFCTKCNGLFFSGHDGNYFKQNQRCPADGLHNRDGFIFVLPHDVRETPTAQRHWRFCTKCNGLFFSGHDGKYSELNQVCPARGFHNPAGYNFVLPHRGVSTDVIVPLSEQERQIVDLVNRARRQAGCNVALRVDTRLVTVTRAHSQDLADHPGPPGLWEKGSLGQQGHYGSDGTLSEERIRQAVGSRGTENSYVQWVIGDPVPPPSAEKAFTWWWESKYGHKEQLLNCAYRTTGVGIAGGRGTIPAGQDHAGETAQFYYYTQAFAE